MFHDAHAISFRNSRLWLLLHWGRPWFLTCLLLICLLPVSPPALAEGHGKLVFGIYSSETPSRLVQRFRPLLDYLETTLSERTGRTVHISMRVAPDYDAGIADIVSGQADFSRLGPASYILARRQQPGIGLLAMENDDGSKRYHGLIITRADSDIHSLADLAGRSFAFGNPNSTSGRYLSQYQLSLAGVRAGDLSRYTYLGRHDRVAEAVLLGDYDAGAIMEDAYRRLKEQGKPVRSLARMDNLTGPWVHRAGLHEDVAAALRTAMLDLDDPTVLAAMGKMGFLPGTREEFDFIEQAIDANPAFFQSGENPGQAPAENALP